MFKGQLGLLRKIIELENDMIARGFIRWSSFFVTCARLYSDLGTGDSTAWGAG